MKIHSQKSLFSVAGLALALVAPVFANDSDSKFRRMDTDGDGKITMAEHSAYAEKKFSECDANKDGLLSPNERESMDSDAEHKMSAETTKAEVARVDTNSDGKISKVEHDQYARRMFTEADTNKDGVLTKEEFEAAHQAKHEKASKY